MSEVDKPISKQEYYDVTWKLINGHFTSNKGYQLVKHLLDSYNDFVIQKIEHVIEGFNPVEVKHQFLPDMQKFKYLIDIEAKNPILSKPTIHEKDGSTKVMTPSDARNRNFTYAAPLYVDLHITTRMHDEATGNYIEERKKLNSVCLGKIPVMVNSRYCILKNHHAQGDECKYDFGSYFIINGNEKVIISQDRIAENKTYVFLNNKVSTYSHVAEIRSLIDNKFSVPKTTALKLSAKPNQFGRYIRANIHHVKHDIPLFILFRALGIESDKEICHYIVSLSDLNHEKIMTEIVGSIEESNNVMNQREAYEYLVRYVNMNGHPKEMMGNKTYRMEVLKNVLEKEFLPHVGPNFGKKAAYLGYMARKLIKCFLELIPYDDRDSYINKRIDTPGVLMANLFRQYYGKVVKDMKNMTQKEINSGTWRATNKFSNVINKVNINKIVKSTIIESGLKFGLATGNWGVKSSKIKQGVAQVLNRMTYNATISHLRRINTPIEKTGKLVQPRKLHNTQWGIMCPSETPEGVSVGLVKNLSVMANVTIGSNSLHVRQILEEPEYGMIKFDGFNVEIFDQRHLTVFVNGDILGVHDKPHELFAKLKYLKRKGIINIYTSIVWNIQGNEMWIYTEAGRCARPTYVVRDNKIAIDTETKNKVMKGEMRWENLCVGNPQSTVDDSCIEYLDAEEGNFAMIAMKYSELSNGPRGDTLPIKYTHLEMDASLALGVLAGSIPFSDHNQAPRNTYQAAMAKQAIGVYTSNYRKRFDTIGHVLNYPQVPLVQSNVSKLIHNDKLPCGINVIVAIATYTGYNQEDSIIMNKSSCDRGLFQTTYYKTYKDQNTKNHSTGEEEYYCKPDPENTKNLKPYNYSKVNMDGFVTENKYVESGDVIIGKCMPQKHGSVILNKDSSVVMKNNEKGFIDRNSHGDNIFTNINGDGYTFSKVRIRNNRVPTIGDKFSCYTPDHEVLTDKGWVFVNELTTKHKVASMVDNALIYQCPTEIQEYDYKGKLYVLETNQIKLSVTPNHRMYVAHRGKSKWGMETAEECYKKRYYYKKNVDVFEPEMVDVPEVLKVNEKGEVVAFEVRKGEDVFKMPIDDWLTFFGIWVAEGCTLRSDYVSIATHKPRVKDALTGVFERNNVQYSKHKDKKDDDERNAWIVFSKPLVDYIKPLSVGALNKYLPDWVWYLSREQCRILIKGMSLGDAHKMKEVKGDVWRYETSSIQLAGDFQRLCLHAGWASNKVLHCKAGSLCKGLMELNGSTKEVYTNADNWSLTVIQTQVEPLVNKNYHKGNDDGNLDRWEDYDGKVYCCTVPRGDGVIYVRKDGFSAWCGQSRSAQKGTLGMIYTQEDMPFTTGGIVPDIIMNPHAIPSRMTMSQLMECIMGKACAILGTFGDATPFTDISVEDIAKALDMCGIERYGNEIMYNPRTGEMMETEIFMGPTYYQRLKHMTCDKIHSRAANGPVVLLSRQPAEGRARDGGLRLGEMEVEVCWAHGMQHFLKERTMDCSDNYRVFICKKCGMIANVNPDRNLFECKSCNNNTHFAECRLPYACKLMFQEIQTMGIGTKFITQ